MVEATLSESRIGELTSVLRGRVIRPGDGDYEDARHIWNAMIDRHPALIVRPAIAADVVAAVNFARDNALIISVRSGGHNVAGNSVCDGGMAIDFSEMKAISVDPQGKTATAEPGVRWGEFDTATQAHGLATTGGTNTDTGIGGLTTGGGIGWLGGKYGLASDNLLSADVVTADGRLIRANAEENQDLFWALRGGGGNFGVITSFTYRLHPVGPLLAGLIAHPVAEAKKVLTFHKEWERGMPDELRCYPALLTDPEAGPVVAFAVCYNGPIEKGEQVLAPLRKFGPPVMDVVGPMAYTAVQAMLDASFPPGGNYYARGPMVPEISNELIDVLVDQFARVTSPHSALLLQQLGGAMARGETAWPHRAAPYNLVIIAGWDLGDDSARHIAWARGVSDAAAPYTTGGSYVNELGLEEDEGASQIKAAFGASYSRLASIKAKYDPQNLFRHNQNIKPAV
jgi:FAD/FMN-containing dehydrogenase